MKLCVHPIMYRICTDLAIRSIVHYNHSSVFISTYHLQKWLREESRLEGLLEQVNAPALYALVGGAILLVVAMCVHFAVKSWRAGLRLGMERAVLKKAVVSSATFTLLPAFSILLGVVALSGTLGIPLPWLRLSVIGNPENYGAYTSGLCDDCAGYDLRHFGRCAADALHAEGLYEEAEWQ